ncbi:hypothetical protein GCM10027435_17170 [Haloparvum alkalitolerans]|uniref:Hsp20/alpha crystallin family protein n=1 Tax=Haloparvum alkalitolerans TaxID=1042953 RepID=UPI003CEB5009
MRLTQSQEGESLLRRYEYDDRHVVAADVGVDDDAVSVDTVGDTAIVVIDHGDGESEAELDLPGPATTVAVTNGVLTIEVEK